MTDEHLARYDAIHVISDIHMGGRSGFQILRETARLAGYIRRLAAEQPQAEVALVLNGDVFDTLAEEIGGYVAIDEAVAVVTRIIEDAAFAPVWAALAEFVHRPRRTLVFVIGNHDIEIALPPVQKLIVSRLAQGDAAARGRIEFSTMGAGYTCLVGGQRVYCIHGNEVDAWNLNRYEDLARAARHLNAGQRLDPSQWRPNAGTKMVKDVMNAVKVRYRWIDLLKPETSAAVGTLLVMDPGQLGRIGPLLDVLQEKTRSNAEVWARLSDRAGGGAGASAASVESLLGPSLLQARRHSLELDMLAQAEASFERGATAVAPQGTLGTGQLVLDRLTGWIRGIDPAEALRRALQDWLRGDATFDYANRDETCEAVLKSVGAATEIVITGHTHLARAIDLGGGRRYFNSGTWIRLMQFTSAMLKDEDSFADVYTVLHDGQMPALDAAAFNGQRLVLDRTTEIEVAAEKGRVVGRLNEIVGDGSGPAKALVEMRASA